jgi:hypothetical protein
MQETVMNKATNMIAVLATISAASTASAQTFTFQAQDKDGVSVGTIDRNGQPMGGRYTNGTSNVTWADGKKTSDSYSCIALSQPPRDSVFMSHSICDASNSSGSYTAVWGCNFMDKERTEMSCVGGLYGKTGAYAGRGGTITFHGKGGVGTGTGQWNN